VERGARWISGPDLLAVPEKILASALALRAGRSIVGPVGTLVGRRVVISAGGTQEPLDPVRFLGNRSSGKQGVALAEAAVARGASVTLVAANITREFFDPPAGVEVVRVVTTAELREAMLKESATADAVGKIGRA